MSDQQFLSRRRLLLTAGAGAVLAAVPGVAHAGLIRGGRPSLTHGVQTGDVTAHSGIVWARGDQSSRMSVELSRTPSFRKVRRVRGPVLRPDTDFTGKVRLTGLPPGERICYSVRLESDGRSGEPIAGEFVTAPVTARRDIDFVWSGDLAGQGWGINPDFGGYRIFDTMGALNPDFFLCSGDFIYADGPIAESVALPDGGTWKNLVTAEKSKVAETLTEFRGQYSYNFTDEALRRFAARVPRINQWDDHEVTNNWYPGEILESAAYTEKRVDVLAARARQAYHEWTPNDQSLAVDGEIYRKLSYGPLLDIFVLDMRTYKDPNSPGRFTDPQRGLLGAKQREWLKRELARSRATWKVLATDLPIGLIVPDGASDQEGIAQGDNGAPLGRELEFADILSFVHRRGITGLVALTADVHYTAAHYYDPNKAAFSDFTPFWEFVSGPLNAGAFGPNKLDTTFGAEAVYVKAPPTANTSPAGGYQFFGQVSIDADTRVMTVRLRDLDGAVLFTKELHP